MKFAIIITLALIATVRSNPLSQKLEDDKLETGELDESIQKRGNTKWYTELGQKFRNGEVRSFQVDDSVEPKEDEKRFWGLYGLGGLYGYGLGFGYPWGFWGKRDSLDLESHEVNMTRKEINVKREDMMSGLIKAEENYFELSSDEKREIKDKKELEKRFWGLYGGLYGLGLGYGYPFGFGLWGKRDSSKLRSFDVNYSENLDSTEQEHLAPEHSESSTKRDVSADETVETVETDSEVEPKEDEKRFWGLYGLGGLYGYGLGFGYPWGFWGKRDSLDLESHEVNMTHKEINVKREDMMSGLIKAEENYYELSSDEKRVTEDKRELEKRFWGLYGGLYGLGLGYGYPYGFGLWGKRQNYNNNNGGMGYGANFNNNNGGWGYGYGPNYNNNNGKKNVEDVEMPVNSENIVMGKSTRNSNSFVKKSN